MRLLTIPVTVVRIPIELGVEVAKRAAGFAYGLVAGGDEDRQVDFVRQSEPAPHGNGRPSETVAAPPPPPPPPPPSAPAPAPEPAHVSEQPELVAEVAEEGAEEGAGAEVHIDEPWPGYDRMRAADIADLLVAEPVAVVAAVKLYEASGKGRASVLEAASRSMGG